MTSMRQPFVGRRAPNSIPSRDTFTFPESHHLLITTRSHILAWTSTGLHTLFQSSKHAIVAAREAKDSSGVLAVADKHVVVLHDTRRGHQKSWGLGADGDEVRHLEYSRDSRAIFLATRMTPDIHRYSTGSARLLSPTKAHATSPIALAVSSTAHLMASASDDPPVVYLKDLTLDAPSILLETRASAAAVSVIAFHPERPSIFLLAFRDGTAAAYDANRLARATNAPLGEQTSVSAGEIGRLTGLHRATAGGRSAASIADMAFLPGYKTRAVSVGADGRCRLVDFADPGAVLRTWHAKAPVASVSVVAHASGADAEDCGSAVRGHSRGTSDPTSATIIIAVGREDGRIQLYDPLGLLLAQKSIGLDDSTMLSVEWVKGPSPRPVAQSVVGRTPVEVGSYPLSANIGSISSITARSVTLGTHGRKPDVTSSPRSEHGRLPWILQDQPAITTPRQFAIHPDEVEEGTVRHVPASQAQNVKLAGNNRYLDLFSPIKAATSTAESTVAKRLASPPRSRPRISSQTFVRGTDLTSSPPHATVTKSRNLALFPSTDSGSGARPDDPTSNPEPVLAEDVFDLPSLSLQRRTSPHTITAAPSTDPQRRRSVSDHNAKVLANLHHMDALHPTQRPGGVLSTSRPRLNDSPAQPVASCSRRGPHALHRPPDHLEIDADSLAGRRAYEDVHTRQHWPDDSTQASSLDADLWLTTDHDDTNPKPRRSHPGRRPWTRWLEAREPAHAGPAASGPNVLSNPTLDGSTEDETYPAHPPKQTRVSPTGTFSPASRDVRALFPRSSSLSPAKKPRHRGRAALHPAEHPPRPSTTGRAPRERALNTLPRPGSLPESKSPWARARAAKRMEVDDAGSDAVHAPRGRAEGRVHGDEEFGADGIGVDRRPDCVDCAIARGEIRGLEADVAWLRAEVLALKAVLRRKGLQVPRARDGR